MGHRLRFLVVDDDPVVLEVVRYRLDELGFEVSVRAEALGTSAAILQFRPDFVLLDLEMPGLPGMALARSLQANPLTQGVRIILHSSAAAERLAELATTPGIAGTIQKTGDDDVFQARIRGILAATLARRLA